MAYEPKPNKGTLWPNDYKTTEAHPDVKGDIFMDRELLRSLMLKTPQGLIKISISGWNGEAAGKKVVNLIAQAPYVKPATDDEIPY